METISDTQFSSSKVYMKCPTCSNPYSVDPLDISTHQPTFDCLSCQTRFFFQWPQPFHDGEVETFVMSSMTQGASEASEVEMQSPQSGKEAPKGAPKEEPPVAVQAISRVPLKVQDEAEMDLQEKWKSLQNHWDDEWWHQSFLSFCDKKSKLSFAASKYAGFLKDNPKDETAKRMQERLKALSKSDLIRAHQVSSAPSVKPSSQGRIWAYLRWWWPASLVVCLTLFMIGYTQPLYTNLIGLSLALLVFTGGVRYLFLPDRTK